MAEEPLTATCSKCNEKNMIIALLIITWLAFLFITLLRGHFSHPVTIREQVEMLRQYDCKLDYEAIEKFAEEWDLYVESIHDYIGPEIEEYH